jgi:DNA-binding transcriptional LysR family regulator
MDAYNASMDLLLTRSFLVVVETGSITDAAERLGVTQSALSRRIQQFEEQLDTKLLSRSRKGVELTDTGRLAAGEGQRLLTAFANLKEQIALHQGLEGGSVRIGGGATAVSFVLPAAIAAFQQAHPKVLFQLKEAGSSEIADDVLNGRLALGIVTLPLQSRELKVQNLTNDDIVLVARKDHPLARRKTVNPLALADQGFVSFEADTALRNLIDNAVRTTGVDINVVMELRSIPSILRMVATTGHLAFVSRMALRDAADIVEIKVKGLSIRRRMAVVSRRNSELSAAAAAFARELMVQARA